MSLPAECPYLALRYFEERDSHLFYGRDEHVRELLAKLELNRFVAVLGSSGCGKSSLVRAGLLPELKSGMIPSAGHRWKVLEFRPGSSPLRELGAAFEAGLGIQHATETIAEGPLGIARAVDSAQLEAGTNVLVIADQFEEIFSFLREEQAAGRGAEAREEAQALVRRLLDAASEPNLRVYVLLVMRSDYLGDCAQFPDLPERMNASLYLVPRLRRDQLQRAIEAPVGREIEPAVVQRLLGEVGTDPDQLPRLQHLLSRMWFTAEGGRITSAHYAAAGGWKNALEQHLEWVYASLTPSQQNACRLIFQRLSEIDRGRPVRRWATREQLRELTGAEADEVVERFRQEGFLRLGGLRHDTVDVVHESVLRGWPRLVRWMEEENRSHRRLNELAAAALESGWRPGMTEPEKKTVQGIAGLTLSNLISWRNELHPTEVWASRYLDSGEFHTALDFLSWSEARDLDKQNAARFRGRILLASLAILAVLSFIVIAGMMSLGKRQQAANGDYAVRVVRAQEAFDRGDYAAGIDALREAQPLVRTQPHWLERRIEASPTLRAHLLPFILRHPFLYAMVNGFDEKVDAGFEWGYLRGRLFGDSAYYYMGHRNEVRSVAVSPDGAWLATGSADSTIRIFDISGFNAASATHPILKCALAIVGSEAMKAGKASYHYMPGGNPRTWSVNQTLDAYLNNDLHLASPAQGLSDSQMTRLGLKQWNPPGVMSVAFSPDNKWIAIGTGTWNAPRVAGTVYLLRTASLCSGSSQVLQVPTRHTEAIDTVVFRNSREFASTSEDDAAEFWNILPDGEVQQEGTVDASATTTKGINAAAFSPRGHTFAMGFGDGHFCTVPISDTGNPLGNCSNPVVADQSGLMSMAWYPNQFDNVILLGTRDGRVVRADRQKGDTWRFTTFLKTGQGLVTSLTFSRDGKLLLTTGSDGTVRIWNILQDQHDPNVLLGYSTNQTLRGAKAVYSAAITLHQRLIVSGGADTISSTTGGRVSFWMRQPQPDGALNPLVWPQASAVAPPSARVVCGGQQIAARIEATWASQPAFLRACGTVQALAYSPSGERIAALAYGPSGEGLGLSAKEGAATIIIQRLAMSPADAAQYEATKAGLVIDPSTHKPMPSPIDPVTRKWLYPEKPVDEPILLAGDRSTGVALAWSGKYLAAAENSREGYCATVQLWDMSGNFPVRVALAMPPELAPDPSQRFDCGTGSKQHNSIQSLAFLRDGTLVAGLNQSTAGQSQAMIVFWNPAQSRDKWVVVRFADLGFGGYRSNFLLTALAFSADGGRMAVGGVANSVQVWNLPARLWNAKAAVTGQTFTLEKNLNGTEYAAHHISSGLQGTCSAVAFSPDGRWLAAGTPRYDVAVWSTDSWKRVQGESVYGSLIDTSGVTTPGNQIYYPPSPPMANAAINTIAFSPDNRRLAYGTAGSEIILWDVVAQQPLPIINVHSGGVLSLAFSPNGECLASGSSDQTLRFTCEVDPVVLERLQRINFVTKPTALGISVPASDRPESDNWIRFAQ